MTYDIICFSHLRWNFVYQRPQHIMTRIAGGGHTVYYFEEPIFDARDEPYYHIYNGSGHNVRVVVSHLCPGLSDEEIVISMRKILNALLTFRNIRQYIAWYYSPMAYAFSDHLTPLCTVYDCMDELSAFLFAPPELKRNELALFTSADIVFTGGRSLFNAKKSLHKNVHLFPSSIDKDHFLCARRFTRDPQDQRLIGRPRIGFYGVLDERLDIGLLAGIAEMRPGWQFILVGPIVKIDTAILPRNKNIHYLGAKKYEELPDYLSGWDIAMMPFAINESTLFISPTKTPEYLAGGKPVISSPIADVISTYGKEGLVHIADSPEQFVAAADDILQRGNDQEWMKKVDAFLENISWDKTVDEMKALMEDVINEKKNMSLTQTKAHV